MRILSWDDAVSGGLSPHNQGRAAAIGVFDGMHRGHAVLLEELAKQAGCSSMVVTFRENPKKILRPDAFTGDIFTLDQKLEYCESFGVDNAVIIDFSRNFSTIPGELFVRELIAKMRVQRIVVGWDFSCGHNLDTPSHEVVRLAKAGGADAIVVPPVVHDGEVVSSTKIRKAIREGNIQYAERLLGHPYTLDIRNFGFSEHEQCLDTLSVPLARPLEGSFRAVLDTGRERHAAVCVFGKEKITWHGTVLQEKPRFIELICRLGYTDGRIAKELD